jgi:hypothetical protein
MFLYARKKLRKAFGPVRYLKFFQYLSTRQSDRHAMAPIPHIYTDPKLYWFFV